ncbi:transcription antitermination factor NusB [Desulfovibrio sp. OttesenSCG-928-I05]|nr:transcription antitermination factor NusB [Desulfovibrio sp. OttesenSCG-928-I05]
MAGKNPTRRAERELAFQVLYGLEFAPVTTRAELIKAFHEAPSKKNDEKQAAEQAAELAQASATKRRSKKAEPEPAPPLPLPEGFAWELVEGAWGKQKDLDERLARFTRNWRLERVGKVEITLLRLALFELLFRDDIPPKVTINEAIELSKQFGDEGSRAFVNGILDAAAKAAENGEL